jgi:hypothetical protein
MLKNRYKLSDQSLPKIAFSDHLADICKFKILLDDFGIRTQNTRIERYQQYLQAIVNDDQPAESQIFRSLDEYPFDNSLDRKLYVIREVHELMWILRGLNMHMPKGIKEKLNTIVGGRDFAALDANSSSRNAQFELRIASYFCQAGYKVDLSTETDVVAYKSKSTYFVECKRVSSKNQLSRRVNDAQKQLDLRMPKDIWKRRHFGVVAVDVTKIGFTHNGLTLGHTSEHTKDIIQNKLIEISGEIDEDRCFNSKKTLLLWVQIHIPALVIHPITVITRFSSNFIVNPQLNGRNLKAFKILQNVLHISELGDPREIAPEKLMLRKGVTLPKGTSVEWDEELLLGYLYARKLEQRESDLVVLKLVIDEKEYIFSYYEFEILIACLDETTKTRLQNYPILARFELAAKLYILRYPYGHL